MALILGLDTGGTFTDAALLDADAHKVVAHAKSLTTRLQSIDWCWGSDGNYAGGLGRK